MGVLTVNTLTVDNSDRGLEIVELNQGENIEVQSSMVDSYRTQLEKIQQQDNNKEIDKLENNLKEEEKIEPEEIKEEAIEEIEEAKKQEPNQEPENNETSKIEDMEEENENENEEESTETLSVVGWFDKNEEKTNEDEEDESLEKINKEKEDTVGEIQAEDFEITKLTWPIDGQIVMGFNDEALVYDQTLNLYRTNDSISYFNYFSFC